MDTDEIIYGTVRAWNRGRAAGGQWKGGKEIFNMNTFKMTKILFKYVQVYSHFFA